MYKILIKNPLSETMIHNVFPEDLGFWLNLLEGAVSGEVRVLDEHNQPVEAQFSHAA